MKKSQLKNILKPLVKECIRESLLEDGVLSSVIAEVARGISSANATADPGSTEQRVPSPAPPKKSTFSPQQSHQLKEHKQKLMAAIGKEAYGGVNLFEGTTPMGAPQNKMQMAAPLAGTPPQDKGVDIGSLIGDASRNWGAHMSELKDGK